MGQKEQRQRLVRGSKMNKDKFIEFALDKIMHELDEIEGEGAMSHDLDDCPNPLVCDMHNSDLSDSMSQEKPAAIKIEVKKMGMPSLDGEEEGDKEESLGEGLSLEEAEELKKLLK